MSKEQLEEIKSVSEFQIDNDSHYGRPANVILNGDDVKWLIKQAERVQELEETNKKNYWIAADFKFENLKLEQQNKRYQHLLKAITSLMETDAEIYLTDKARLNGIHDALVEFYAEYSEILMQEEDTEEK